MDWVQSSALQLNLDFSFGLAYWQKGMKVVLA